MYRSEFRSLRKEYRLYAVINSVVAIIISGRVISFVYCASVSRWFFPSSPRRLYSDALLPTDKYIDRKNVHSTSQGEFLTFSAYVPAVALITKFTLIASMSANNSFFRNSV